MSGDIENDKRYSLKAAAERMDCSPSHLRNLMNSNAIPYHTDTDGPNARRYVRGRHIVEYMEHRENRAA